MVLLETAPRDATQASATRVVLRRLAQRLGLPRRAAEAMARALRQHGCLDRAIDISVVFDPRRPELHASWLGPCARGRMVGLDCVLAIADLFVETSVEECVARWSVALWPTTAMALEVHLSAQGRRRAPAVIEEAMCRLGFAAAWSHVMRATERGPGLDEMTSFGVGLDGRGAPWVEVRVDYHDATRDVVRRAIGNIDATPPAHVARFLHHLTHASTPAEVITACFLRFDQASRGNPISAMFRVPVGPDAADPVELRRRIGAFAHPTVGYDSRAIGDVVEALHMRPAPASVAVRSVAIGAVGRAQRLVLRIGIGDRPARPIAPPLVESLPPAPAELVFERYVAESFCLHPFFGRIGRETPDRARDWMLLENLHGAVVGHSARRLAGLVARVDDDRTRSLLARKLDLELGFGDYARSNDERLRRVLASRDRERPGAMVSRFPGARLSARLDALYSDDHPCVGIGAMLVADLLVREVIDLVGTRWRERELPPVASEWNALVELPRRESMEHALRTAGSIAHDTDRRAASRGGDAAHAACWAFLDGMYRLCFPA